MTRKTKRTETSAPSADEATENLDLFANEMQPAERTPPDAPEQVADIVPALVGETILPPSVHPMDDLPEHLLAATRAIRIALLNVQSNLLQIGLMLIEVKESLDHGQWLEWLRAEFPGRERTAQRYMAAAITLKGNFNRASRLSTAAIYEVGKPSVPVEVREAVFARVDAGEHVEAREIKEMIREHKLPEPERKALEKKKKAKKKADERRRREWAEENARMEKEREEQKEAARRAVAIVVEVLGDRVEEFRKELEASRDRFGDEAYAFFVTEPARQAELAAMRAKLELD